MRFYGLNVYILFVYSDEVFHCGDYVPLTSGPVNQLNWYKGGWGFVHDTCKLRWT